MTPTTLYIHCRRDGEGEEANVEVMVLLYSTVSHCLDLDQWTSLLNTLYADGDDSVTRAYRGKTEI